VTQRPLSIDRASFRPPSLAASGAALVGADPRGFEFARGALMIETGAPLVAVYLVTEGLVAILARTPGGARGEAGLVGPGGLVGHQAALGARSASTDAVALVQTRGLVLEASALTALASEQPHLHREVVDYALARAAETERLCACAAAHSIERRLARWLLSATAVIGEKPIEVTHQQLAQILAVRRASVTTSLHLLEGEHAIRCRRSSVEIRNFARLEAASCGCHAEPWRP
jgi:CRP-like cAMP-binding protein